jgi:hypothetical protein
MENDTKEIARKRVRAELEKLLEVGGIKAELVTEGDVDYVIYYNLETAGASKNLPTTTDVLVAVPGGYPAARIDMPALLMDSPLAKVVVGSSNPQNIVNFQGKQWRFLSYHPYDGDKGPNWTPTKHGFHDYYQHLYTWLHIL